MFGRFPQLDRVAEFLLFEGLAPLTRKTYKSRVRIYVNFCRERSLKPFPAAEEVLVLFVAFKALEKCSHSTVKSYLSAIASTHYDSGLKFDLSSFSCLSRVLRGLKRVYGVASDTRLPITVDLLQTMLALIPSQSNLSHCTIRAAFAIAVFGLLRCGEFAVTAGMDPLKLLRIGNVKLTEITGSLKLLTSKTDVFRKGVSIVIPCICDDVDRPSVGCPFHELNIMIRCRREKSLSLSPASPLFLLKNGTPLSRSVVNQYLLFLCKTLGLDSSRYTGHSFRKGGAQTLANAGAPDYVVQMLGRWSSSSYLRYIKTSQSELLQYSLIMKPK